MGSKLVDALDHLHLSYGHRHLHNARRNQAPVIAVHQPQKLAFVCIPSILDNLTTRTMLSSDDSLHFGLLLHNDAQAADDHLLAAFHGFAAVNKVTGADNSTSSFSGHLICDLDIT